MKFEKIELSAQKYDEALTKAAYTKAVSTLTERGLTVAVATVKDRKSVV